MDKISEPQNVLAEIKKHIDLMSKQLDLLVGSGLSVSELDVYVLMNRTRQIYELVCSVETAKSASVPVQPEANGPEAKDLRRKPAGKKTETVEQIPIAKEEPTRVPEPVVEPVKVEEENNVTEEPESVEIELETVDPEPVSQKQPAETDEPAKKPTRKAEPQQTVITQQPEHLTIADKMAMQEDASLAARLQRKSINDLKSAIGINEKFLFVNELFGGSMEKYNKSINLLNEVATLEGAKVCLDELKIELQWSSSSEAYAKLKDLVTRRFEVK